MSEEYFKNLGNLVMANAAKNAINSSNSFFGELNDVVSHRTGRPIYNERGGVVGLSYPTSTGEIKTVTKGDIASNAKRMQTAILISSKVAKRI